MALSCIKHVILLLITSLLPPIQKDERQREKNSLLASSPTFLPYGSFLNTHMHLSSTPLQTHTHTHTHTRGTHARSLSLFNSEGGGVINVIK
jgi:hypothetical protein